MQRIFTALFVILTGNVSLASKPEPWQLYLQEAATPVMEELTAFHDFMMIIITGVTLFVFFLIIYVVLRFNAKANPVPAKFSSNLTVEIAWTLIPVIILIIIAVPSFRILKMAEHTPDSDVTVKVVGSQWFWTYSYPDHGIEFDSYMIQDEDLLPGQLRLLEVDNRIIVPQGKVVKFLITAADVIHSFAVPALGIKLDAVPGRTNETWAKIDKIGVYYGQCSELCGVNHGFMPIAVEVVSQKDYDIWVESAKVKFASHNSIKPDAIKMAANIKSE
ncbi:MAG: cytochrome c oxidase subunit II [Rickettsiales bacterium]|nr:MAG: cytochrome c oxidase subunit II [Rickettsiales bacterium]